MSETTTSPLDEIIRNQIGRSGSVSFRWFMEQALYHPQYGYYASGKAAIGREGDFFTNVSVGPLFGKLLAGQFLEIWERMGKPEPFTIVEQGANDGRFACDVLQALKNSELIPALRYVIIEPFEILEKSQRDNLRNFSQACWRNNLASLESFCGIHFSNELLDAMPCHLVRFSNDAWHERHVTFSKNEGSFVLVDGPPADEPLVYGISQANPPRIEGYQTEINLNIPIWLNEVSAKMEKGFLITIDYGYPRSFFNIPERVDGTLSGYSRHHRMNPLSMPGEIDISAHVEFTSVVEHAQKKGFLTAGFTDQHHFMAALGVHEFSGIQSPEPEMQKTLNAFKTLMHPELMGLSFKVLALQKGIPKTWILRGFQFDSSSEL